MADDTNRKMDEMLRAYAQKRGEGPAAPLHPATRRMLQDEVRRLHASQTGRGRAGWLLWWPRLAFGSSLCLVAILTLAILKTNREPAEPQNGNAPAPLQAGTESEAALASRDSIPSLDAPQEEKRQTARADQSQLSFDARKEAGAPDSLASSTADHSLQLPGEAQAEARHQLRTDREAAEAQLSEKDSVLKQKSSAIPQQLGTEGNMAAAAPSLMLPRRPAPAAAEAEPRALAAPAAGPAAARPEVLARAADMTNLGAALRTRFVQTNLSPVPVLRSFQMEQLGELVKFVDLDGSVYTGQLQRAEMRGSDGQAFSLAPTAKTPVQPGAIFLRQAASNSAAFSFTAAGVNRTLGSPVTVQGEYFSRTNRLSETAQPSSPPGQAPHTAPLAPSEFIFGRTVIAGTNEAPLRAISVER